MYGLMDKHSSKKVLSGLALLGLAAMASACSTTNISQQGFAPSQSVTLAQPARYDYAAEYAGFEENGVYIPAFDHTKMDPKFLRQQVKFSGSQAPGSIVVDTSKRFLYFVQPGGRAIRYGIAVGKEGFAWHGDAVMKWKQKWPTWTPPPEMIARTPRLAEFADGMGAGVDNPLGARAMYLFKDGRDTLFRVHGTNRPYSIGKAASSGCFRMVNQDVIDLYARVSPGAKVYVRQELSQRGDGV